VFSQFTGFLDLVCRSLDAAGVPYCYLDGKARNRAAVVKQFKSGEAPVFLISLEAGGFGWNPATEAQAVDRTHRTGQTRNVMVYRLIAKGKVMELKARKAALFSGSWTQETLSAAAWTPTTSAACSAESPHCSWP
jgi:SNF2 family DNA or RNA helicase